MKGYKQAMTVIFFLSMIFSVVLYTGARAQEKIVPREVEERQREDLIREPREIREERLAPPPPAPVMLSEEDKEELSEFFKQIYPDIRVELKEMESTNPAAYDKKMQRLYREYIFLKRIEREEPERFSEAIELRKLSEEVNSIAEKYKKTQSESEKNGLKIQLNGTLSKLFDLRENERALEIDRIKERLSQLQQEMDERQKNKEQIIQKRLNELIGKDYLYDW